MRSRPFLDKLKAAYEDFWGASLHCCEEIVSQNATKYS